MSRRIEYEVNIWRADGNELEGDHNYFSGKSGKLWAQRYFDRLIVHDDITEIDIRRIVFTDDDRDTETIVAQKGA